MKNTSFKYCGETFRPYRKLTKAEREQPASVAREKLQRYYNETLEAQWDLNEFYEAAQSDCDLFFWKGKVILPTWDSFFFVIGL